MKFFVNVFAIIFFFFVRLNTCVKMFPYNDRIMEFNNKVKQILKETGGKLFKRNAIINSLHTNITIKDRDAEIIERMNVNLGDDFIYKHILCKECANYTNITITVNDTIVPFTIEHNKTNDIINIEINQTERPIIIQLTYKAHNIIKRKNRPFSVDEDNIFSWVYNPLYKTHNATLMINGLNETSLNIYPENYKKINNTIIYDARFLKANQYINHVIIIPNTSGIYWPLNNNLEKCIQIVLMLFIAITALYEYIKRSVNKY